MNEFKILNNIGRGSFSKVKRVLRIVPGEMLSPLPKNVDENGDDK